MSIPGFSAETSLYKTSQSYHGPRSRPAGDAGSTIVAQQSACVSVCLTAATICRNACRSPCCVSVPFVGDVCIPGCTDVCDAACNVGLGICVELCGGPPSSPPPPGGGGGGGGGGRPPIRAN